MRYTKYHVVCRECAAVWPFSGTLAAHLGAREHDHDCEVQAMSGRDRHADAVDRDWKAVRHEIGLTRRKLACKLGTSYNTVGRWENDPDVQPAIAYQRDMLAMLDGESP